MLESALLFVFILHEKYSIEIEVIEKTRPPDSLSHTFSCPDNSQWARGKLVNLPGDAKAVSSL